MKTSINPTTGEKQRVALTEAQEIALGLESAPQMVQQMGGQLVRPGQDPRADLVAEVGTKLVRSTPAGKSPYAASFAFHLIDHKLVNAFALPGGPVWIHRGVLHAATSESQVAGVLAHEIAHVAQRHAARQVTNGAFANWGLGLLSAMLGNSGGATAARSAAGLMTNGIFLRFNREDERDADRVGLQIMMRAGWDGRGMVELFDILRREQKRDPSTVEQFFSSHPSPAERIEQLRAAAGRRASGRRDTAAFRQAKARSMKLTPPRRMPAQ
jgi:predicted Zn-dependent protease